MIISQPAREGKKKDGGHRPFACFLSLVSARRRRRGGECHSCLLGRHSMRVRVPETVNFPRAEWGMNQ